LAACIIIDDVIDHGSDGGALFPAACDGLCRQYSPCATGQCVNVHKGQCLIVYKSSNRGGQQGAWKDKGSA
jgi:hypothetical protein